MRGPGFSVSGLSPCAMPAAQVRLLTPGDTRYRRGRLWDGTAMYAVVVTGGKQYRVSEGSTLVVDRVTAEPGEQFALDQVLLLGGDSVQVGTPLVSGAEVRVSVISHEKGEKTEYTRYLHRRRTRKTKNGRAKLTVLKVESIQFNSASA